MPLPRWHPQAAGLSRRPQWSEDPITHPGLPSACAASTRALWASPSPPVGLRLGDLRGGPRLAAGPRLGGRTCPRQSQLASQLLNFPSRALRPPLRQHPCLSIRSAHTHPPLARGGRVVCLLCSPSQSVSFRPLAPLRPICAPHSHVPLFYGPYRAPKGGFRFQCNFISPK